jgi:hypothetical protein
MATRNLTKQFVGIRNANKANKNLRVRMDIRPSMSSDDGSSDSGLLNANETPYKSVKDSLPPVWVDKLEKAEEDLTKIQIKSALQVFYFCFLRCLLFPLCSPTPTSPPHLPANSERAECIAHEATNGKL